MSAPRTLSPEVRGAIVALVAIFMRAARAEVERKMDEEDRQPQQKPLQRIAITRPFPLRPIVNAATTPRAPAMQAVRQEM